MRLLSHSLLERGKEGEGVRLKLNVQGQGGGKILDIEKTVGWGVLKIRKFSWK